MQTKINKDVPKSAGRFKSPEGKINIVEGAEGTSTFSMVPYAGQQFKHWYWQKLAFETKGFSFRKKVIPAFLNHNPDKLVGEIDSFDVYNGKLTLSGDFIENEFSKQVLSVNKLNYECSLAFDLDESAIIESIEDGQTSEVNGEIFHGPGHIVKKCKLNECSFTLFGAVPDTETSFSDQGGLCSISVLKEETMDEKEILDKGKNEALGLFSKMNEICDDANFVTECFSKNKTFEEFQCLLIEKLKNERSDLSKSNVELSQKLESKNSDNVTFHSSENEEVEDLDFRSKAKKLQKEEGLTLAQAFSKVAREEPDLYRNFIKTAPLAEGGVKR